MGATAATLRLKRAAARPARPLPLARPAQGLSKNALCGIALYALLWLGYNTYYTYVDYPDFLTNTTYLIHGIRAFFPMTAAWFACLLIFIRAKRVTAWIMGPMGLVLMFGLVGMASSWTMSVRPLDAMYWGVNYLAIGLVLLAVCLVDDPLPDLLAVLKFTWFVGILITLSLLGAIPFLGAGTLSVGEGEYVGPRAYGAEQEVMGMPSTRNTGFARYAAISALVALAAVIRKGRPFPRALWGIVLGASLYALYLANGRTETLAFVVGLLVILSAERAKRVVNFLVTVGAGLLLGLRGFYSAFYLYITRTGHFDPTLTGRTLLWEGNIRLFELSPWVGLGFQADRYFGAGHVHDAFLHVLVEAGILGGGAILLALGIVWYHLIRLFFLKPPADKSLIPPEIPAVFLFVTISSFTESTFAYFSAAWLLSAPIIAYAVALRRHVRRANMRAAREHALQVLLERRRSQNAHHPLRVTHTPLGGSNRT